jgi:hypothetical protein
LVKVRVRVMFRGMTQFKARLGLVLGLGMHVVLGLGQYLGIVLSFMVRNRLGLLSLGLWLG